jgi:hypothetical protein
VIVLSYFIIIIVFCTTNGIIARLGIQIDNTINMASTKYKVEKFNGKNNLSLAKKDERSFDSAMSLQGFIGKCKKTPKDG